MHNYGNERTNNRVTAVQYVATHQKEKTKKRTKRERKAKRKIVRNTLHLSPPSASRAPRKALRLPNKCNTRTVPPNRASTCRQ